MKQDFETHMHPSPTVGGSTAIVSSDLYSPCMERSHSYVASYERREAERYDEDEDRGYIVLISLDKSDEETYEHFHENEQRTNEHSSQMNELNLNDDERRCATLPNSKNKDTGNKHVTMKDIRLICRRYMERNLKHGVNRSVTKKDVHLIRKRFEDKKGRTNNGSRRRGRYVTSISFPKRKTLRKRQVTDEYENNLSLKNNTRHHTRGVTLSEKDIDKTENDDIGVERCFRTDYGTKKEEPSDLRGRQFSQSMENPCMKDKKCSTVSDCYFKPVDRNSFKENVDQVKGGEEFISKIDEYFAEKENIVRRDGRRPGVSHIKCFITDESAQKERRPGISDVKCYITEESTQRERRPDVSDVKCEYDSLDDSYMSASRISHEDDLMDMTRNESVYVNYFPKGYTVTTGLYKGKETRGDALKDCSNKEHGRRKRNENVCESSFDEFEWKERRKKDGFDIVQVYDEERKEGGYFKRKKNEKEQKHGDDVCVNSFAHNCEDHCAFEQEEEECGSVNCFHLSYDEKAGRRSHYDQGHYVYDYKDTGESEFEFSFDGEYENKEAKAYESEDLFHQIHNGHEVAADEESGYCEQVHGYRETSDDEFESTFERSFEQQSECDYTFDEEYEVREEETESEIDNPFEHAHVRNERRKRECDNYSAQEYKRDKTNKNVFMSTSDSSSPSYPRNTERANECVDSLGHGYSIRKYTLGNKDTKECFSKTTENRKVDSTNLPSYKGEECYDNSSYYKRDDPLYTSERRSISENNRKEGYSITLPSRTSGIKRTFPRLNFM